MTNPKLDKSLRALVVIDRGTVSSVDLANALNVSRPTAVRLVESLRELGCTIASEREGHDYWYRLADWRSTCRVARSVCASDVPGGIVSVI